MAQTVPCPNNGLCGTPSHYEGDGPWRKCAAARGASGRSASAVLLTAPTTLVEREPEQVDLMETHWDRAFTFDEDGAAHYDDSIVAPDYLVDDTPEPGWSAWSAGRSNQYGYKGPTLHQSEVMSEGMAQAMAEEGGTYVVVISQSSDEQCDDCDEPVHWSDIAHAMVHDDEPYDDHLVEGSHNTEAGWAILRKDEEKTCAECGEYVRRLAGSESYVHDDAGQLHPVRLAS